ncbi:MAG: hypothetical protein IJJ64_11365 [Butyrivibrio sp.]|nr:hypothetical protein [Butyrivibrio sp.]
MFSVLERDVIMRDYFKMHIVASSMAEFQSMNGDWWVVFKVECHQSKKELMRGVPKQHRYVLYHKHADGVGYHEHGQYCNVVDAILEVINHDDYRQHRKGRTHFEELLDEVRLMEAFEGI